jgi:hypothetical protein
MARPDVCTVRIVKFIFSGIVLASFSHANVPSSLPVALPNDAAPQPLAGGGYKFLL